MDIRTYLCRNAAAVTNQSLTGINSAEEWNNQREQRLRQYYQQLGIAHHLEAPRTPLNTKIVGVVEREEYKVEKLYFESLPKLYVTGHLYVPNNISGPAPAVAYFCGHSPIQKLDFQDHCKKFAQLGFVVLVVDTIQYGEIRMDHHGIYNKGRFNLYSRGYTPAGVETWNGIRAVDLLCERPEVDADRIGVTGISGGGGMSWWSAAADDRLKISAPVCGTGTIRSHIEDRTIDGHCDCMHLINHRAWDMPDFGALIAPRPLMVASANMDGIYKIESIRETYEKVKHIYTLMGAEEDCHLVETPGPHSYHEISRTKIFSFFLKHLMGKDVPPEEVGDIDVGFKDKENLLVFPDNPPADEAVTRIEEDFIPKAKLKAIQNKNELETRREEVIARLKETSFSQFPKKDAPLDVDLHFPFEDNNSTGHRFSFTSEPDIRVPGRIFIGKKLTRPAKTLVILRTPGELCRQSGSSENFIGPLNSEWAHVTLETRGVGDLSWGPELNWHVRRATAWMGKTVASLRIYDTLRGLEAVRQLEGVDPNNIALIGRGQMASVALFAALLDGNISAVLLTDPPSTLDARTLSTGEGPELELLSCLQTTDLPDVASLLWPTELVFLKQRPQEYKVTEQSYQNLGSPGILRRINKIDEWKFSAPYPS